MSRIYEALLRAERERQVGSPTPLAEARPLESSTHSRPLAGIEPLEEASEPELTASTEDRLAQFRTGVWSPDAAEMLFAVPHQDRGPAEQFRILRSKLYQERTRRHVKTVLVTSAVPGEGKTFVAANLAQAIGQQPDRRPLLIDGDLRRSSLHQRLGARRTPGLSEYLHGEAEFSDIVQASSNLSMYFMASGERVSSADLIESHRMGALLDEASGLFDWIIVDSPPVTLVSDSLALSKYCDGILIVVSPGTPIEMIQKLKKDLGGKPVLGVVYNRVDASSDYYYYTNPEMSSK